MTDPFFEKPILNAPYDYPRRHWELDATGQPTQKVVETRRPAEFITPIPKPKKQKGAAKQESTDKPFNRLKASIAPLIGHHPCAKIFVILTTA